MTDVRARIEDALRNDPQRRWGIHAAEQIADALLSLPGIAVVDRDSVLLRLDEAHRNCAEDAADDDRPADERAFYSGQGEGYRLAAQWILAAANAAEATA